MSSAAPPHVHVPTSVPARVGRAVVVAPVVLYQRAISPAIPRRCKYEPTCSGYAIAAVRRYGIWRGAVCAGWRLLRCNPWSHGGYDPVESQRIFDMGAKARDRRDSAGVQQQSHPSRARNPREPPDFPIESL